VTRHHAGKAAHPRKNYWSSYSYYARGRADPLIIPSPSYLALRKTLIDRQREYRAIVQSLIEHGKVINI